MILINFKIYKETFGDRAIELGKIVKEVSDQFNLQRVITASPLDAYRIQQSTGAKVWLQNIDEYSEGKATGWVSAKQAQTLGINGSLLNHSEHKIPKGKTQKIISQKPKDFQVVCCVSSLGQIEKWAHSAQPDWILYEPPELIASLDKSVATEKSDIIKKAVKLSSPIPLMVGAGVKSKEDVEVSLKMGAKAVGLSSAFVLASDPRSLLTEIAQGFGVII